MGLLENLKSANVSGLNPLIPKPKEATYGSKAQAQQLATKLLKDSPLQGPAAVKYTAEGFRNASIYNTVVAQDYAPLPDTGLVDKISTTKFDGVQPAYGERSQVVELMSKLEVGIVQPYGVNRRQSALVPQANTSGYRGGLYTTDIAAYTDRIFMQQRLGADQYNKTPYDTVNPLVQSTPLAGGGPGSGTITGGQVYSLMVGYGYVLYTNPAGYS